MAKLKKGDVVRLRRDQYNYWSSDFHNRNLTVTRVEGDCGGGNVYFEEVAGLVLGEDLELVGTGTSGRRTFQLIKDTPTLKKGALLQEACDDGTQEYVLLDQSFHKDDSAARDTREQTKIYDRSLVENQPKWFVEVFKVLPEYMTREELDQWEAFKGRKKPGRKPAVVTDSKPKAKVHKWTAAERAAASKRAKKQWTPAQRKAQSERIKAAWAAKRAA